MKSSLVVADDGRCDVLVLRAVDAEVPRFGVPQATAMSRRGVERPDHVAYWNFGCERDGKREALIEEVTGTCVVRYGAIVSALRLSRWQRGQRR
jgi:hypothetical protein